MKKDKATTQKVPPYVSYKTLENFIDNSLKKGVPGRIDASVYPPSFSGSIKWQLTSALTYLGLINSDGIPENKLDLLVAAAGTEDQQGIWKTIIEDSYGFLLNSNVDLKTMTPSQLREAFEKAGTSGATTAKAIRFFMSVAKAAGIGLSPHVKAPRPYSGKRAKKTNTGKPNGDQQPHEGETTHHSTSEKEWNKMLLDKFPTFDPTWPDDVKAKWFDAFDKLMGKK